MRVNTSIPEAVANKDEEGRAGSPRTKVSYHFQGLQLEDRVPAGGEISQLKFHTSKPHHTSTSTEDEEEEQLIRKRVKMLKETTNFKPASPTPNNKTLEIPETPDIHNPPQPRNAFIITIPSERPIDPTIAEKASKVVLHNDIDPVVFTSGGSPLSKIKSSGLSRSYPSINRLADSKSRRKRAGTPPLDEESGVVDPERAALTWHDDEITGRAFSLPPSPPNPTLLLQNQTNPERKQMTPPTPTTTAKA
jgi:hypothetical protein